MTSDNHNSRGGTVCVLMTYDASGPPHLHPVGQPVALGVGALHREEDVAPRDDAALRHRLDLDGEVAVVLLPTEEEMRSGRKGRRQAEETASFGGTWARNTLMSWMAFTAWPETHHETGGVDFAPA